VSATSTDRLATTARAVGLIWLWWSPTAVSYLLSDGSGGSVVIPDESEAQIAGDGRFMALTVLAGVLFGIVAWMAGRPRGPLTIAVLGAGSVLGSALAMATGQWLSGGTASPALNTAFHPKLALHASAALWLQALVAVLVYTSLAGLSADPTLGAHEQSAGPQPVDAADAGPADPNPAGD
jgi:hypothetical protein